MEKIEYSDINFLLLKKLQNQGSKSTTYTDDKLCYKILDGLYPHEKNDLFHKFQMMSEIRINNVLLPIDLIVKDDKLIGYTMKYFSESIPLSNKFLVQVFNCKDLFEYVIKSSHILREIHKNGIICSDLSFENILVDKNNNIAFCDLDGCTYDKYESPFISLVLKRFLIDYRKSTLSSKEDLDKLSMILSFYLLVYGRELQELRKKEYHSLSDNIQTLENLKNIANILVNKFEKMPNLPYLDEVIDRNDDFIIDRNRQLRLNEKVLRLFK